MDRKSIIVLAVCFGLLLLWSGVIVPKLYPPIPVAPTNSVATAPSLERTNATGVSSPGTSIVQHAENPAAVPGAPLLNIDTNIPEQLIVLSNNDARYTFTSHGGGLKLVELLGYPETVPSRRGRHPAPGQVATLNRDTPVPTLAVLDGPAIQSDGIFKLTPMPGDSGVRAEKTFTNGLTLTKEFILTNNYLLTATVRWENHSSNTISLPAQEWVVGTATPMNAQDKGVAVGLMWFNGQKAVDISGASYFATKGFACMPRTPPAEYRGGDSNVVWAATHNQFFALALMPQDPAISVVARRVDLPRPTGEEALLVGTNGPPPQGLVTTLVYPATSLEPNQPAQRQLVIFAGPKEYRTLSRIAAQLNNGIDAIMGFNSIWGFFAKGLLLGMNTLHNALRLPYGWTIVVITIIIKVVFWPITQAQTRMSKRMAALQPQIKAMQEKYKDDPVKAQKKMMELWKENKVNPMSGCLPVLIQMPIFIGFFTMIRTAIELRGASFLWIPDLSAPDTVFVIPGLGFIPFIGIAGVGLPLNLLPLIMVATMLWQSHLTPVSPGVDPTQQKMMRYLPLVFLVLLYNYSAGMALYWTTNNLLTILQTKLTKTQQTAAAPAAPALTPPQKKRK